MRMADNVPPSSQNKQNNKRGSEQAQFECTVAAGENTPKGGERTGGGANHGGEFARFRKQI